MLAESAAHGERATRQNARAARGNHVDARDMINGRPIVPTLADIGITRDQSSRYQQLASMSDEHFEAAVATARRPADGRRAHFRAGRRPGRSGRTVPPGALDL